ncbi:DUF4158 domain-containing protein [Streptomyces sp. NPDC058293]|uniref:DUF4158 domain-containing protein n=1 Tax=Streptomyces sp. NPDC058293 TaxID=3346429 RepID=UPI0036EF0F6E
MTARGARNRIGWAVQLGTIRYLGDNPEEVPAVVTSYVAEQLGLDPGAFAGYGTSETRWAHQEQIRNEYEYTKFESDQWFALARWLYQRAWIGNERPTLLFDLATKRLLDKKVVLPGVTVLERLVSGTREHAEKRLFATLAAAAPTAEQAGQLRQLVVVPTGKRPSELDRLRRSPRDISARGAADVHRCSVLLHSSSIQCLVRARSCSCTRSRNSTSASRSGGAWQALTRPCAAGPLA